MKIDLHTHSTVSDGSFSPLELIQEAEKLNLSYFSITDHDSIDALEEIPENFKFITGVELSAEFPKTLHILGYNFDLSNKELRNALTELQEFRFNRNEQILDNMKKMGFNLTLTELKEEAKGEIIGRPHFANLMFKKGFVSSYQQAFDKFLAKGKPLYLNKKRLDPKLAIELILDAGGIPVIAHPYQTKLDDVDLEKLIKELIDFGLMGIEAYYSQHSSEQVEQYLKLANKYKLIVTAGSDFHGSNKPHISLGMEVPEKHLNGFLERIA